MEDQHRQPIEASSGNLDDLFFQACPSSGDVVFFRLQMQEAARRNFTFPQALRFAVERRYEAELLSKYCAMPKRAGLN